MVASSVWVSAVSGSLSQSHSSLCLASLLSVSPLYPLLFFFLFFPWFFFAFSVTPFGLWCWVFFFFLIDYLGHGLLGWPDDGFWTRGVHGSWIGRMMGWGGSWYFGRGPEQKTKGGPSPFFFGSLKILLAKKKKFWAQGGPGPPWGSTWVRPWT